MAIYAIFNVAIQNRKLADVRMRGFYVEKVYWVGDLAVTFNGPCFSEDVSKIIFLIILFK